MPKRRPPYLQSERTRHGARVWYVRKHKGARVRLRAEYDSRAFWQEYADALETTSLVSLPAKTKASSLKWALDKYHASSAWAALSLATRRQRENIFRRVIKSGGHTPLEDISDQIIREGRERRAMTPHAANGFIKAMRGFCAWCVEENLMATDPTAGVKLLTGPNDAEGFHTWTQTELDRFEARWKIGTRERLAFDVLLYTGLRRGDAVRVGRQHVRDGVISIRTEKHARGKQGELITIPILPPLATSLAAAPTGDLTFLINERGQPWVKESFGNWFRDVCRKAHCPGSAHGLRKAGATRAAEQGASERQLMAIFGWTTGKMAQHYTRSADRARLAHDAAQLLLPVQATNEKRPHLAEGAGRKPKRSGNSGV
ncbi:tyrosine-type recombinase/integrase [Nitrobacter vulgaris]|uniref:Integrase n=1 Tax=Nitrobacter vulgaris TaxID=29421 RepID=A0A1V4I295_NITVU|nr:tyrosine-type recombinase/integrase [Nitrobacter vulgaris]OPH84347.1 integrase [Nitrobacter vulgaris]